MTKVLKSLICPSLKIDHLFRYFQAVTIRDSDNNMKWDEDQGLLTYRARKVYSFVPELSAEGFKDPDNIYVTGLSYI